MGRLTDLTELVRLDDEETDGAPLSSRLSAATFFAFCETDRATRRIASRSARLDGGRKGKLQPTRKR